MLKKIEKDTRVKKAMLIAEEHFDMEIITDIYTTPDFVEFSFKTGGDNLTCRVYNDGEVYER